MTLLPYSGPLRNIQFPPLHNQHMNFRSIHCLFHFPILSIHSIQLREEEE